MRWSSISCRKSEKLIRLLTPAFDKTPHDPGYIKGYLPGVRENGGQYTHGVLWARARARGDGAHGARDEAARDAEPDHARTHAARRSTSIAWSRT